MVKTNEDIICELCIKSNDGVLEVDDEDKKIAWKSYHEKLLNIEFTWVKNSLSHNNTVRSVPHLTKIWSESSSVR